MIYAFLGITLASILQNAWLQLKHMHERKHWDTERRQYVSAALAAQTNNQAAAAVIRPTTVRPDPPKERFLQVDA